MASKAKIIGSSEATQPEIAIEEREVLLRSTRDEEIRNRAYEIYLQRGDNLAMNWRIGFRLNESSRNESCAPLGQVANEGAHILYLRWDDNY
jgi:hypothetical protein